MSNVLIAYDICDPRRLARVHRALTRFAVAIQYSVFIAQGDWRRIQPQLDEVVEFLNLDEDDLRAYLLPKHGLALRLGRATLPEGITYTGLPSGWHELTAGEAIQTATSHCNSGKTKDF